MVAETSIDVETIQRVTDKALFIREETIRLISIAKVGHYASVFSCAELLSALYYDCLRIRKGEPDWVDRDRFLFGKGHAAVGLYPVLVEKEFFGAEILSEYTRVGNPLGDHPDMRKVPGIDFSSGSLGHALSVGVGMAHGARLQKKEFLTYVMLGDGELQEGQIWEAAMHASTYGLSNLVAIIDRNGYQLDGEVDDIINIGPIRERWESFGWEVHEVDGHDVEATIAILREIRDNPKRTKPVCLVAHTVKGKGIDYMETEPGWHLGWLSEQDEAEAYELIRGDK
ncbi:transketolase [Motiliproteus sp. MSK22-1]|uniref:transketolase n=1 Tax=Motiliproteus sp. MSK22-1 TaxID=1897630 RepID=UPI00117F684F|nr:transketolase [Motiliproteus sp. MSK22-1]